MPAAYESFRAWLPFFARLEGGEVVERDGLAYWTSDVPLPFFNGAIGAADDIDGVLGALEGRPLLWIAPEPAALGPALERRGFHVGVTPGMTIDLAQLPALDDVEVREVTHDPDALAAATLISLTTNGFPELALDPFLAALGRLGEPDAVRTFLATVDGEPAAASVLSTLSGDAGLFNVGTLEAFRGRGLGRAVSLAPLHAAREADYTRGVLGATEAGGPVYRRIGFVETERMTFAVRA